MNISKKRLKELEAIKDENIDFSDIPELDEDWFKNAKIVMPETKKAISLRIDNQVLIWFKAQGIGYQSRINDVVDKVQIREFSQHKY
jgi:uncharacterized protein (DUF4415 family)